MPEPALYPLFLHLRGRKVVLVGGGRVAAGKLVGLLGAGAEVTVVAPSVLAELRRPGVIIHERPFTAGDLDGAWLCVAAATPAVNAAVAAACEARRVFVNAVDDLAAASAFGAGVFERGGVTVAVSTGGAAPALAGLLREGLEAVIPDEIGAWVDEARAIRSRWKTEGVPMGRRRPLLLEALERLYRERKVA